MSTIDDDLEAPPGERAQPSRSELRSEAEAYTELAEKLARGPQPQLPDPPFDADLRAAIDEARRLQKNARSRQIRRVAQLMRGGPEIEEFLVALDGRSPAALATRVREQLNESWRARLISEGDSALMELMELHPRADRKRLRQLLRQAKRAPADARSKRASTALIRELRALFEAAAEAKARRVAEAEQGG